MQKQTWNQTQNGHNLLPPLHETSGETQVFSLPKPRVPSQFIYFCVFPLEPLNGTFSFVKCDVSMHLMFLIKLF